MVKIHLLAEGTGVLQSLFPWRSGHCSSSVIESCHGQMDHPFTPGPSIL